MENLILDGFEEQDVPLVLDHIEGHQVGKQALVYKRNELIHAKHGLSAYSQKIVAAIYSEFYNEPI